MMILNLLFYPKSVALSGSTWETLVEERHQSSLANVPQRERRRRRRETVVGHGPRVVVVVVVVVVGLAGDVGGRQRAELEALPFVLWIIRVRFLAANSFGRRNFQGIHEC